MPVGQRWTRASQRLMLRKVVRAASQSSNAEIGKRNEGHGVPPETPIRAASAIQARAGAGIARNMLFIHTLWRAGGGC